MVLKVGSDARKIYLDFDVGRLEQLPRANTTELQHLRRMDSTSSQNNLLPGLDDLSIFALVTGVDLNAGGAVSIEDDLVDLGCSQEFIVVSVKAIPMPRAGIGTVEVHWVHGSGEPVKTVLTVRTIYWHINPGEILHGII